MSVWKYLPAAKKEALTYLTLEGMQRLLNEKQYGHFYDLHRTLVELAHEGLKTLNADQKDCLIFPYVCYGTNAAERNDQN